MISTKLNESPMHSIAFGAAGSVQTFFVRKITKRYNDNYSHQSCDIDNDEANNNTNKNTNNTECSSYVICADNQIENDIKFVYDREFMKIRKNRKVYEIGP